MRKGNYLPALLRSKKTVLTSKDIALLWQEAGSSAARVRINYYVKKGDLYRIRKGLYSKNKDYNKWALATRVFTPSYVSFETVLAREGLIFQYYSQIMVASYLTRELRIDGQVYVFRQVKHEVLINTLGVEHVDETSTAAKERAFLDSLYVHADYHFDNLKPLDWELVFRLLPLYDNKRVTKNVHALWKQNAHGEATP